MEITPFAIALSIGFLSAIHCLSMCGGIMAALVMGVGPEQRARLGRLWPFVLSYNLGRLLSYFIGGGLIATIAGGLFDWLPVGIGHDVLRVFAGVLMIGAGLYLAGWYSSLINIERLGLPLWNRIQPLGRRLMPVRTVSRAFVFGLIWGWLPCGLVYTMLFTAAGQGDFLSGGLFMLVFGLGTLPAVFSAGLLTGRMMHPGRIPYLRQVAGVVIIALALVTLVAPGLGWSDTLSHVCAIPGR